MHDYVQELKPGESNAYSGSFDWPLIKNKINYYFNEVNCTLPF